MNAIENKDECTIKTITYKGSSVSFSPKRGGIITSIKIRGKEILFLNEETFYDPQKNVRGGIPNLFPNAGALEENDLYTLKQHGFGRMSAWRTEVLTENAFRQVFHSNDETMEMFPFMCELSISGRIEEDGSITLEQGVKNLEINKEMPVAMGLHPYFPVSNDRKRDIEFHSEGGDTIIADRKNWLSGGTTVIDTPNLQSSDSSMKVNIPELGTLRMSISVAYHKIWIWTEPGKDFICLEPMMREQNGLLDDPEYVLPREELVGKVHLDLNN